MNKRYVVLHKNHLPKGKRWVIVDTVTSRAVSFMLGRGRDKGKAQVIFNKSKAHHLCAKMNAHDKPIIKRSEAVSMAPRSATRNVWQRIADFFRHLWVNVTMIFTPTYKGE